jgi:UDP-glucuronate 4-epimerase
MKRVFVTGIAGFIGFHVALALRRRGDFVIGCDDFNPYYDPLLKKRRAQLLHDEGITVLTCDINDSPSLHEVLKAHAISHFVHLAAQAGVRHATTHPESYVHSNLDGFASILELLRKHEGMPFIYASSSSVYGLNEKIPFSERDPTERPASFYGATKKANEMMAHAYYHLYRIPCTALRFFTVYGPWGRPDMAYYSFTKAILEGRSIPVFGDGSLRRDFTYIDDIIQGTVAALDLSASCEVFNLGGHQPHSILDLIRILEQLLNAKARIEFQPLPRTEVMMTFADISKSQACLNFQPLTPLEEGLARFVQWYQFYEKDAALLQPVSRAAL